MEPTAPRDEAERRRRGAEIGASIPSAGRRDSSTQPVAMLAMSENQAVATEVEVEERRRSKVRVWVVCGVVAVLGAAFFGLTKSGLLDALARRRSSSAPAATGAPNLSLANRDAKALATPAPTARVELPAVATPRPKGPAKIVEAPLSADPDTRAAGDLLAIEPGPETGAFRFRWIPAGEFVMGSPDGERGRFSDEGPATPVALSQGYWLGEVEISRGQFRAFATEARYDTDAEKNGKGARGLVDLDWRRGFDWTSPGFSQPDDHPVVCVSWRDAQAFCDWLGTQCVDYSFRLPTEAEWERAARAGSTTRHWWGESDDAALGKANGADVSLARQLDPAGLAPWNDKMQHTAPVGSFEPNAWGLRDMSGNVAEWCADWFHSLPGHPVRDYRAEEPSIGRVLKGGGWASPPTALRPAFRDKFDPEEGRSDVGFRIVAVPVAPSAVPAP